MQRVAENTACHVSRQDKYILGKQRTLSCVVWKKTRRLKCYAVRLLTVCGGWYIVHTVDGAGLWWGQLVPLKQGCQRQPEDQIRKIAANRGLDWSNIHCKFLTFRVLFLLKSNILQHDLIDKAIFLYIALPITLLVNRHNFVYIKSP